MPEPAKGPEHAEREEIRAELLEAMDALHQAHAALIANDPVKARTQLDKATVIIADVRKQISQPKSP